MTLIILFASVLVSVYFLIRNERVYKFRGGLVDVAFDNKSNWRERSDEYCSVSYYEMVFKFWKPLTVEAFYKRPWLLKE